MQVLSIKCRTAGVYRSVLSNPGNIKEVERLLGISYPTVRNRLDNVIEALGYRVERDEDDRRKEILKALDKGEITVEEGIRLLKK